MREYEAVLVFGVNYLGDRRESTLSAVKTLFKKSSATVDSVVDMNKKRLAYPIRKFKEGIFFLYQFKMEPTVVEEFKKQLRLNEAILTFIVIRESYSKIKKKSDEPVESKEDKAKVVSELKKGTL